MPKSHSTKSRPQFVTRDVDRHENERFYFRRPGSPKLRLPGAPGEENFEKAYKEALTAPAERREIGASRTVAGSLNELVISYMKSQAFAQYAATTKDSQRWRLERMRVKHGGVPVSAFDRKHVHAMLNKLSSTNQRNWLKTVRALFRHGMAEGLASIDPTEDFEPKPVKKSAGFRRWEDEHIAQFEAHYPIGTRPRLTLALLRFTGLRISDLVRLGPQHIRGDQIVIKTQKTGKSVTLPILPELAQIIAATKVGHLAFLVSRSGKPYSAKSFGSYMRKWCDEAGLHGLSAHGVRHAVGCQMSEREATIDQIMAVLGHSDPAMALHYTRQASQMRLAKSGLLKLIKG